MSLTKGLFLMSSVIIHIIKSWNPLEYGQDGGNFTQLGPLWTAKAILSPFSKIKSNGDFQNAIAYNKQPRDWKMKESINMMLVCCTLVVS